MRYKILSVFAALAVVSACGDLTSINKNPNGPVDVPPPSILPNVLQTLVGNIDGVTSLNIRGPGLWVQYYSQIQYRDEDKFKLRSGTSGGWGLYNSALEDIQRMIQKGEASSAPNWSAVGRILKSYTFGVMTEAMGDLPYSQALKGDTVLHPTYDTQQQIYNGLFADLTQASSEIDSSAAAVGFSSGDLMYGGDMAKWRRFANSERLRLAMHLSKADATKAQTEAAAAVAAGVFESNADNAELVYLGTSPNQNPIYRDAHVGNRDDYGMSKTYVDSLTSWGDPRLPIFAQLPPGGGTYNGLPNGLKDGQGTGSLYPLATISRFGALWRETAAAPMDLLTYSEVLFLEAEAAERGWIPGGTGAAANFYTAAITASMEQYGVAASDITNYIGQGKVAYDAAGATLAGHLQQIAYQKWVSLFMQGTEAWTELRRTQIPTIVPGCFADFRHTPERLPYDDNEAVLNSVNLDAAVAAQGLTQGNDIGSKPLWFTGRTTSTDYPAQTSPTYCP
jgi:SusD/RagB-like outer membrane lipoprotein